MTGSGALGCGPGSHVGDALEFLLERVLDDPDLNTPKRLLALLPIAPIEVQKKA